MKYGILPFVLVVLLAGCKNPEVNNSSESKSQAGVGIDSVNHYGGLLDSIREPSLRNMVIKDSTEIIKVEHKKCYGNDVELLTYIDYSVAGNIKKFNYIKKFLSNLSSTADCNLNDTVGYVNNPYKEMNGVYLAVYRYKGQILYSGGTDGGGWPDKVLMDKIMYSFGDMGWCQHYISTSRDDQNRIKYNFSGNDTLEIKLLDDKYELQLWKWSNGYNELRIRIDKGMNLPTINFWNNIGEAACGSDTIIEPPFFDKIDYDSLMISK